MRMLEIKAEMLNADSFKPYGEIIGLKSSNPEISNDICSYTPGLSDIQVTKDIAQISLLEVKKPRPFILDVFERHIFCSEAAFLLSGQAIGIFGLPNDLDCPEPDIDLRSIRAFILDGSTAINTRKKVWHCMPFPLSESAVFAIIFEKDTHKKDVQLLDLALKYDKNIKLIL